MYKWSLPFLLGAFLLAPVLGCGDRPEDNGQHVGICGDGVIDPGEECDGDDLRGRDCTGFGFYGGELVCTDECTFDTSQCFGYCGDGAADLDYGEDCDGEDLAGVTCQDLGWYEGLLACSAECSFDATDCHGYCGDGEVQAEHGEVCDDGVNDGVYGCMPDCSGLAPKYCGDGIAHTEHGEACDGEDLADKTCRDLGFYEEDSEHEGVLSCAPDCTFDVSLCVGGHCGDGILQEEHGEECDGEELGGVTCRDLGWYEGVLACSEHCSFDATNCQGYCGDGQVQEEHGEVCDDGVNDGVYGCLPDCSGFAPKYCGDGLVHSEHGEQCDGENLNDITCEDLGFESGVLACNNDCRLDTSGCEGGLGALRDLFGDTLYNANEEVVELSTLVGKKIGIYFTTGGCGPCLGFTPILVDVYHELRDEEKPFAVIVVSWDRSEEDMFNYMRNYNMPWKAVPYHSDKRRALNERYGVTGVPTLIIIDCSGETLSTNGRWEVQDHGAEAYDLW